MRKGGIQSSKYTACRNLNVAKGTMCICRDVKNRVIFLDFEAFCGKLSVTFCFDRVSCVCLYFLKLAFPCLLTTQALSLFPLAVADFQPNNDRSTVSVTCLIMQKNGAGMYSANSCYFDGVNDEVATVKWPGEKQKDANKTLNCIVTVTACML